MQGVVSPTLGAAAAATTPPENEEEACARNAHAEAARRRKARERKQKTLMKHDFKAYVKGGFERPYVCSYPGCDQAFQRPYTLKVHEKSHEAFENYHKYKKQAQLFYDADSHTLVMENMKHYIESTSLPPIIQRQLNQMGASSGV